MQGEYHFDDFTEQHYRHVLDSAAKRYAFEPFGTSSAATHVLWRHDVDISVHRGAALARMEAETGVRSTYFLQLRSTFYNLLEREVATLARGIIGLGHWAGLHFDLSFYGELAPDDLVERLGEERRILEGLLEAPVKAFSFHNPSVGNALELRSDVMAGMANAYGEDLRARYRYVSDSSGHWRFDRLASVIEDETPPRLHVLTHPEWWQAQVMSPRERVARCAEGRARRAMALYDAEVAKMGRENIGLAGTPVDRP